MHNTTACCLDNLQFVCRLVFKGKDEIFDLHNEKTSCSKTSITTHAVQIHLTLFTYSKNHLKRFFYDARLLQTIRFYP